MSSHPALPRRWIRALKFPGWPKTFLPALFGQALALTYAGHVDLGILWASLAYTAFLTAWIVLLNDWADRDIDGIKRHVHPLRSSAKTLPDGLLTSRALLIGAGLAGLLAAATGQLGESLYRPMFPGLAIALLIFLPIYSLPPVRLNYRGGGELLEALGVGFILPIAHFLLQANVPPLMSVLLIASAYTVLALGSAWASGMTDEGSDRIGGKRTAATRWGTRRAATAATLCIGASLPLWAAAINTGELFEENTGTLGLPFLALITGAAWCWQRRPTGPDDRTGITRFKKIYHRCQWGTASLWAVLFTYEGLFA